MYGTTRCDAIRCDAWYLARGSYCHRWAKRYFVKGALLSCTAALPAPLPESRQHVFPEPNNCTESSTGYLSRAHLDCFVYWTHLSEDDVLSVQPRSGHGAHEELGPVGVLARVGHRQHASLIVDQLRLTKRGLKSAGVHVENKRLGLGSR